MEILIFTTVYKYILCYFKLFMLFIRKICYAKLAMVLIIMHYFIESTSSLFLGLYFDLLTVVLEGFFITYCSYTRV